MVAVLGEPVAGCETERVQVTSGDASPSSWLQS